MIYLLFALIAFLTAGWLYTAYSFYNDSDRQKQIEDHLKLIDIAKNQLKSIEDKKLKVAEEINERKNKDSLITKLTMLIINQTNPTSYTTYFLKNDQDFAYRNIPEAFDALLRNVLDDTDRDRVKAQTIKYYQQSKHELELSLDEKRLENFQLKRQIKEQDSEISDLKKDIEHAANSLAIYRGEADATD